MSSLRERDDPLRQFASTDPVHCVFSLRYDCQKLWGAFEQAYVGRDPCDVPVEAYDSFVTMASFKPACNKVNIPQPSQPESSGQVVGLQINSMMLISLRVR